MPVGSPLLPMRAAERLEKCLQRFERRAHLDHVRREIVAQQVGVGSTQGLWFGFQFIQNQHTHFSDGFEAHIVGEESITSRFNRRREMQCIRRA